MILGFPLNASLYLCDTLYTHVRGVCSSNGVQVLMLAVTLLVVQCVL
jgi:hypothetical protein